MRVFLSTSYCDPLIEHVQDGEHWGMCMRSLEFQELAFPHFFGGLQYENTNVALMGSHNPQDINEWSCIVGAISNVYNLGPAAGATATPTADVSEPLTLPTASPFDVYAGPYDEVVEGAALVPRPTSQIELWVWYEPPGTPHHI